MQSKADNPSRHLQGQTTLPIIELYFDLCHLKQLYRQGWLQRGIEPTRCESVAEHTCNVALLAMVVADQYFPHLDITTILRLALLHDVGEIDAGDLTPADRVPRAEKVQREYDSLTRVLRRLPHAAQYLALWQEYEAASSPEARLVRQVEKLEMALQASVYEHQQLADLDEFFTSVQPAMEAQPLRQILSALQSLRQTPQAPQNAPDAPTAPEANA